MQVEPRALSRLDFARFIGRVVAHRLRDDSEPMLRDFIVRYGSAIRVRPERGWLGRPPKKIGEVWVLTEPKLVEAVLIKHHRKFDKDPLTQELEDVLGQGLLVSDGDVWKYDHALVQPVMTAPAIRRRSAAIVAAVRDELERWPAQGVIQGMRQFGPLTLEVVSRVSLGVSLSDQAEAVASSLEEILDYYQGYGSPGLRAPRHWNTPARRRFSKACEQARSVTQTLIERRAALAYSADDPDALGRLLARHRELPQELPSQRLRDQAMTLMLAGNETTTIGLACALRELADNPDVQRRWHEEIDAVDLDGEDIDVDALSYTRGVWRETLRMHPPAAGVGRVARDTVELPGLTLPPKTLAVVPAVAMHRLPEWFPNPDTFVPQRWIDRPTWPRHAYLPFGAGPRVCIGSHLADIEAIIALALLGRRYRIEPAPEAEPLRFSISVTRRPKGGVPVRLVPRN